MMYGSWGYNAQWTVFWILGQFLPFDPPNNPKNKNFEKMKKMPADIILQMFTINDNHIMYGSLDVECNRIFSQFGPFFALLLLLFKKWHIEVGAT